MALFDWADGPETMKTWASGALEVDFRFPSGRSDDLGTCVISHRESRQAAKLSLIRTDFPKCCPATATHPLHLIDQLVESASCDAEGWGGALQDAVDDRSIHPECLIRALLLQGLYSLRCDHQLKEQLTYNFLYRWFVRLSAKDPVWEVAAFARARKALQDSDAGGTAFRGVLKQVRAVALLWSVHFNVDENFFDAWIGPIRAPLRKALLPVVAEQTDCLVAAGLSVSKGSRNNRLEKALAVILQRIGDSTLTPDAIASAACVSRRALFLLFKEQGLTPTKAMRNIRLEQCKKILGDPAQNARKITDVALDLGFGDVATFCRQFKDRYGLSPRDFRATASCAIGRTPRTTS